MDNLRRAYYFVPLAYDKRNENSPEVHKHFCAVKKFYRSNLTNFVVRMNVLISDGMALQVSKTLIVQ